MIEQRDLMIYNGLIYPVSEDYLMMMESLTLIMNSEFKTFITQVNDWFKG